MKKGTVSKISKTDAADEARALLPRLSGGKEGNGEIDRLCATYSGAARADVLTQVAALVKERKIGINGEVLAVLVRKNIEGQKAPGAERLLKALIEVGAASGVPQGGAVALAEALLLLGESTAPETFRDVLNSLGEGCRVKTRRVAGCLEQLATRGAPKRVLELWAEIAVPCMGGLDKPMSFSQKECDLMLASVSRLSVEQIPRSLEARLSLLIGSCTVPVSEEFLTSPVGRKFRENVGNLYDPAARSSADSAGGAPKKRFTSRHAETLGKLDALLVHLDEGERRSEDRHRRDLEEMKSAYRENLSIADERSRRFRNELQQSKSEEKRLSEENKSLRSEADALKRRLNEFKGEVDQLNLEVDSRQADQRERLAEDLRTAFLEPAGNLRDSIEGVASQLDDPGCIRPLAVAFEQLHRKLRRRLNAKDERRIDEALLKG